VAVKALKVGLLADTSLQLNDLDTLIRSSGHTVEVNFLSTKNQLEDLQNEADWPQVDAWVARLNLQTDISHTFMEKLDSLSVPVIYDDLELVNSIEQEERIRRFSNKINLFTGGGVSSRISSNLASEVWVLVASTGGVEAVAEFLRALPKNLSRVAFLYVQHIDANISTTLKKAVIQNTTLQVFSGEKSHKICEGCIYIVSPDNQFELSSTGVLNPVSEPWLGPFSPSADQVMARVARVYGKSSGAIIFSGMGDDGSESCRFMKYSGGEIWTQSPESCTVDSMPVCAQNTGCVSFSADAGDLALKFAVRQKPTI